MYEQKRRCLWDPICFETTNWVFNFLWRWTSICFHFCVRIHNNTFHFLNECLLSSWLSEILQNVSLSSINGFQHSMRNVGMNTSIQVYLYCLCLTRLNSTLFDGKKVISTSHSTWFATNLNGRWRFKVWHRVLSCNRFPNAWALNRRWWHNGIRTETNNRFCIAQMLLWY